MSKAEETGAPQAGQPRSTLTQATIPQASEVAQAWAQLVVDTKAFPTEAAKELMRLLGHSLAAKSAGERRQARLGLLIELVSTGSRGEYVTTTAYGQARRARMIAGDIAAGEDWPDASNLIRAYGHWLAAIKAASAFWFDGGAARVADSYRHGTRYRRYEPQEITSALLRYRQEHGQWPTECDWDDYSRIRRQLSRRAGKEPRVPNREAIARAYGTFDAALSAARSRFKR
jgi:hypothetical protein